MEFKSAKDMKRRYIEYNKTPLTQMELDWVADFKSKIKSKMEEIYDSKPYINTISIYSDLIPPSATSNGGSEKFFEEINYLERELRSFGYKVSSEFAYCRGLAESYVLYLSWEIN